MYSIINKWIQYPKKHATHNHIGINSKIVIKNGTCPLSQAKLLQYWAIDGYKFFQMVITGQTVLHQWKQQSLLSILEKIIG